MNNDTVSIVIVSPSEFPGSSGDTYNFLELINQILFEGFKVVLICPKSSKIYGAKFEFYNDNLEIHRINCKPPRLIELGERVTPKNYLEFIWFMLLETITVFRIIRSKKVKKLYMRHHVLTMQLPLLFKMLNITTLVDGEIVSETMKHLLPGILFRIFSSYEKKIIKLYSYFRVDSISQVLNLESIGYPRKKILIIPVSINTEKIPKYEITEIPEHTFGYFGGLESWQRIDVLIEAFRLLVAKVPSAILYIIGSGSLLNDLQKMVSEYNLQANIIFVGKTSREKLWNEYFKKFRIVVVPRQEMNNSLDNRMPIKLVESMAAGKPIIAMDIPIMREIVGTPLLLIPSGEPELLANAMFDLTTNKENLIHRANLSLKSSLNYDIRNNIRKIISILS